MSGLGESMIILTVFVLVLCREYYNLYYEDN